jgi:hypothetical protein
MSGLNGRQLLLVGASTAHDISKTDGWLLTVGSS